MLFVRLVINALAAYGGVRPCLMVLSLTWIGNQSAAQSILSLGIIPGTPPSSASVAYGVGVNADGPVVALSAPSLGGDTRALRWSLPTGLQAIGVLPGASYSSAASISADGSRIVGQSAVGADPRAFTWSVQSGIQLVPLLPGANSARAIGISGDGFTVVGWSGVGGTGSGTAFRWRAGDGIISLGALLEGETSEARAANSDGSVIVGWSFSASGRRAVRWVNGGAPQSLGVLPGLANDCNALGVSQNGDFVVGSCMGGGSNARAFRWSVASGMQSLGALPGGSYSVGYSVTADGSLVVGQSTQSSSASGWTATIWHASLGMVSLQGFLDSLGADTGGWSVLGNALGISADGRYVVGWGVYNGNQRAFLADLGLPCWPDLNRDRVVDGDDLGVLLSQWGLPGNADLNGDETVDGNDLGILLGAWGPCPQ
jgi:uncharacterized membrane protein